MIDIRKLKELVRLMVENDLSELDLKDQEETVTIKRGGQGAPVVYQPPPALPGAAPAQSNNGTDTEQRAAKSESAGAGAADAGADDGLVAIESPMVGTFYSAANPDSPPFVQVGSTVSPDTTVCILEAMKVFNEIKSEVSGVVERVLVENGQSVEFGQKLFLIRPQ